MKQAIHSPTEEVSRLTAFFTSPLKRASVIPAGIQVSADSTGASARK